MAPRDALRNLARHPGRYASEAAAVASCLVIVGVSAVHGTYALWNDSRELPQVHISAGSPQFTVTGLENLTHEYSSASTSTAALVTVTNTGNTRLHDFSGTATITAGSAALADAITVRFWSTSGTTCSADDPAAATAVDFDTWMAYLELDPGGSQNYCAAATIDADALAANAGASATTQVTLVTGAGTSWHLTATASYTQSVDPAGAPTPTPTPTTPSPTPTPTPTPTSPSDRIPDPVPVDNWNITFTQWSDSNIGVTWGNPAGIAAGTTYRLYIDGFALPDTSPSTWSPQYSISNMNVPTGIWTGAGTVHPAIVTVIPTGQTEPIAHGTIWIEDLAGGGYKLHVTNPAG